MLANTFASSRLSATICRLGGLRQHSSMVHVPLFPDPFPKLKRKLASVVMKCVAPPAPTLTDDQKEAFFRFMETKESLVVITGAGISTESGIPDYRSPGRPEYNPIQHTDFIRNEPTRRRYRARSMVGYSRMSKAIPNETHKILVNIEATGVIKTIITQNVDHLHHYAGSKNVIELHGSIQQVECLGCKSKFSRKYIQDKLEDINPNWIDMAQNIARTADRPDGDIELGFDKYSTFNIPDCEVCSGVLKPAVVFFGGSVPAELVTTSYEFVQKSDGLLVLGSSLTVWSAYRFVVAAKNESKPICIVNIRPTRGDEKADLKIEAKCSELLRAYATHANISAV